jgi:hypothetical protein
MPSTTEGMMFERTATAALALAVALIASAGARAEDASKYPDWKGQWIGIGAGQGAAWDPGKPAGPAQAALLTPEYQAKFRANLAARAAAKGIAPTTCLPPGMPRSMIAYEPMEIIPMPDTTYVMLSYMNEFRRIFTDGRKWPEDLEPSYAGYSIGQWVDENGDGRYDALTVETRGLKGPRTFDDNGLALHEDNETVVKEKIYLDKNDLNLLHDEVTTIDHALTKPWTVIRSYSRQRNADWPEYVCSEDNHQVMLGKENYLISADGYLSPTRPGQPPPDLKYFNATKK